MSLNYKVNLSMRTRVSVIVDGFSVGKYYPSVFNQKDVPCVHVTTRPQPFKHGATANAAEYLQCLVHDGDLAATLQALSAYEVLCVVAGSESGVELSDSISEALALKTTNGTALSHARRDKFAMVEALKAQGIKTVEHFKSNRLSPILTWISATTTYPVVVKALDSAGTDGVFICDTPDEVTAAFNSIIDVENFMGQMNREVLVQSYLRGVEYIVNSVSCEGRHFVNDLWEYKKKYIAGHGNVYDRDVLLSFEGELQAQLISYTHTVLNALGINYGPTHAEVMMTEDGPVLVEVAARLSGATSMEVSDECVGHNAIQLAVDSYVDHAAFYNSVLQPNQLKKFAMVINLANEREGIVQNISIEEKVHAIASYRSHYVRIHAGDTLNVTTSIFSSPASFQLAHVSLEQLEEDYLKIQAIALSDIQLVPVVEKRRKSLLGVGPALFAEPVKAVAASVDQHHELASGVRPSH
jgi:biotin carboxylase